MTEEIVKFLGGAAIAMAAIAWLVRCLITHFLSKDVETFKQELQSESAIEVERLRNSLRLIASEQEKQIHLLQERRAEVIAQLYSRLIEFVAAAESFARFHHLLLLSRPSFEAYLALRGLLRGKSNPALRGTRDEAERP